MRDLTAVSLLLSIRPVCLTYRTETCNNERLEWKRGRQSGGLPSFRYTRSLHWGHGVTAKLQRPRHADVVTRGRIHHLLCKHPWSARPQTHNQLLILTTVKSSSEPPSEEEFQLCGVNRRVSLKNRRGKTRSCSSEAAWHHHNAFLDKKTHSKARTFYSPKSLKHNIKQISDGKW